MEEDIKHLEKRIELNRQMYLEFGRLLSLDEDNVNAIENLINKNKELETMIELMADRLTHYRISDDGVTTRLATREEKIEWFRKKAKGE